MDEAQRTQVVDALDAARTALSELGGRLSEDDADLVDPFNRAMSGLQSALRILGS